MYHCACAFQALKGNPRHWLLKLPQLRIQRSPKHCSREEVTSRMPRAKTSGGKPQTESSGNRIRPAPALRA